MKILIGTGASEPERCTSKCMIKALKKNGHEVCVAGPVYGRNDTGQCSPDAVDIDLPDKPYPERYTYKEILDKCLWKPDAILQIEPHFYFTGEKPKEIKSFYWVLDPHRGGYAHRDMAVEGCFDTVFITQPFFSPAYNNYGLKTLFLPQALDQDRIHHDINIEPECDIAFIGETGIHESLLIFDKYDNSGFAYCDTLPDQIILRSEYREYAERAQLIGFLKDKFDVRIYAPQTGSDYCRVIQKGEIGFHRSLFKDIALRIFEIMACRRMLVADNVPYLETVLKNKDEISLLYNQYGFDPFLPNFKLDYEEAEQAVEKALNDVSRFKIQENGYQFVLNNHTYEKRAEQLIQY